MLVSFRAFGEARLGSAVCEVVVVLALYSLRGKSARPTAVAPPAVNP